MFATEENKINGESVTTENTTYTNATQLTRNCGADKNIDTRNFYYLNVKVIGLFIILFHLITTCFYKHYFTLVENARCSIMSLYRDSVKNNITLSGP